MRKVYAWSIAIILVFLAAACTNSNNETSSKTKAKKRVVEIQKDLKNDLIEEFGAYSEKITEDNKRFYRAYNRALKLWKIPFQEVNVPTRYGNAHVIVSGPKSGKKLVLLHGLNATSTMWYPNIEALSKDYRVYCIDFLLDPSKSTYNEDAQNVDAVLHWHNDIFKKLKLDTFSIVGASRGGWLAVKLAASGLYGVEKLILLSPAQTFTFMPHSVDMFKNVTYSFVPKKKKFREILETLSANVDNLEQAFVDLHYVATKNAKMGKFMVRMQPFLRETLKSLTMTTLVLIGDNDLFNSTESLENAKKFIPQVETKMIAKAGHFLSVDQADQVNRLILDFLMKAK